MPSQLPWLFLNTAPKPVNGQDFAVFALHATSDTGGNIARALARCLNAHEERTFEDGERKIRPLDPIAGKHVYVIQSLHSGPDESAHDKLCGLLFFIGTLKDAGAATVTAVIPYLCYARKDRRTKALDPVTSRYVAQLFEAVGTDVIVVLEVHNPVAFENGFCCRTVALTATPLLLSHLKAFDTARVVVASPDPGGVKRATLFREAMEATCGHAIDQAFVDKRRSEGRVTGDTLVGDVEDATVLIIDDLISTGNTLARAARAAHNAGARQVVAFATHGLFMRGADEALADPAIDRLIITDSVPAFRLPPGAARNKLEILQTAPLFGEAIRRLHTGQTLNDLFVF